MDTKMFAQALLIAAVPAFASGQSPVQCPPSSMTEGQIETQVKAQVPDDRIALFITTCHVSFGPRSPALVQLKNAGASPALIAAARKDSYQRMSLREAHDEVAALEDEMRRTTISVEGEREQGLAAAEKDYQQTKASLAHIEDQGKFEKDTEYQPRVRKWEADKALLERRHTAANSQIASRYAAEANRRNQADKDLISVIEQQWYPVEGAIIRVDDYDANNDRLIATVNGEAYWFTVPTKQAKDFYGRASASRVLQSYEDDSAKTRYLVDAATGTQFVGVIKAAGQAALQAQQQRLTQISQAQKSGGYWIDTKTGLVWALKDSSNIIFREAEAFCQQSQLGGLSGWRLPMVAELRTIYDRSVNSGTVEGKILHTKGGIAPTAIWTWTADRTLGSDTAFNLETGQTVLQTSFIRFYHSALCVHDPTDDSRYLTVLNGGQPVAPTPVANSPVNAGSSQSMKKMKGGYRPPVTNAVAPASNLGPVYQVGAGVTAPSVLMKVNPEYSEEARKAKYSGEVLLSSVVDTNGKAQNIKVTKSLGMGLDEKAVEAVSKWTFRPGTMNGVPVNVRVQLQIIFRLQ